MFVASFAFNWGGMTVLFFTVYGFLNIAYKVGVWWAKVNEYIESKI